MRVAIAYDHLYPRSRGGGERVYRRMAELLVERGVEVDYLTRADQDDPAAPAPFAVVPVWAGELTDEHGNRRIGAALAYARAVRAHLRRERGRYDLVIASALPVLTLLGARAGAGRGTPVVADWLEVWPWAKWRSYSGLVAGTIATVLQRVGSRAADLHTVNSRFTRRRLAALSPSGPVEVLGLFDLIPTPPAAVAAAEPPTAVFLGRLIPDKRADAIPAAIAAARERIPMLRAVIAGGGPERERILAAVAEAGLDGIVEVPGFVDAATAERLVGTAAVMVNPSAREGFGLVVVEAAAVGVPSVVVAGEDNAAAELVEPGVNGHVAPDVAGLADAIVAAVEGGEALRGRTLHWYRGRVAEESLARSVDRMLRAAGRAAPSGPGTGSR